MTRSLLALLLLACGAFVAYYLWPFLRITGFSGSILFLSGGVLMVTLALAPLIYPWVCSWRQRPALSRHWLFALVVACLSYGCLTLLMALTLPVEIYLVQVAPQLQVMDEPTPLVGLGEWMYQYAWVIAPIILALTVVALTRYLLPRWARVVDALRD